MWPGRGLCVAEPAGCEASAPVRGGLGGDRLAAPSVWPLDETCFLAERFRGETEDTRMPFLLAVCCSSPESLSCEGVRGGGGLEVCCESVRGGGGLEVCCEGVRGGGGLDVCCEGVRGGGGLDVCCEGVRGGGGLDVCCEGVRGGGGPEVCCEGVRGGGGLEVCCEGVRDALGDFFRDNKKVSASKRAVSSVTLRASSF